MFKTLHIFLLVALFTACGNDKPTENSITENDLLENVESFQDNTPIKQDIAAYKTVVNVIRETGLAQNFVILPGNVSRVKAYIKNNERILEYNPEFMQKLQGDTNWHGISVLAHQIGHHLSNHELKNGHASPQEELEADKYAGFVLHKMGASLDEAISAMKAANKEEKLEGSVAMNARLAALTQGWNNSKLLSSDTLIAATPLTKDSTKVLASKTNEQRTIASSITRKPDYTYQIFLALDTSFYYINDANLVFKEKNNKYEKVGEKRESNKPGFDWIFVKGEASYGVDARGRLWAFSMDGNFHVVGQAIQLNR